MNGKERDTRWVSFIKGVSLWLAIGFFSYALFTVRGLHSGSCLTDQHMAYIEFSRVLFVILVILGFFGGLYRLYEALKESDN